MALNRAIGVFGGLAILGGVVALSVPSITVSGQRATAAASRTTHSIKVTLAPGPGEKGCQVRQPGPETAGVYPSDTVRFNVENGCKSDATVSIGNFQLAKPPGGTARLFSEKESWPKTVPVPSEDRRHLDVTVAGEPLSGGPYLFEYQVTVGGGPKPAGVGGTVYLCQRPPCPPAS